MIDANTMEIHYSKHAAGYAKNLKEAVAAENTGTEHWKNSWKYLKYSTKMRNNAGGHYNHEMFWQCMRPKQNNNRPTGDIARWIDSNFGSFDKFKTRLQ